MSGGNERASKNQLKNVSVAIRQGSAADVCDNIKKWAEGIDEPLPDWDLTVGAGLWHRCAEKDKVLITEEENIALDEIYHCLIRTFIKNSKDVNRYLERIKVFAATLKYFVSKKRLDLEILEELLQEISKSSFHVRQHDLSSFKTICMNFYALIWNYMRENHLQLELLENLSLVSLSVRWLVILGLDQFQNISHKLSQVSSLFSENMNQSHAATISDFLVKLSTKIVDLLKQVIVDDSNNGLKVKKKKSALPVPQFHGILNITFVLARQLTLFGEFEKALKIFRPVISVAQIYFESDLRQVWKSTLDSFVKICMVLITKTEVRSSEDIMKSSDVFRDCRKQILDVSFQKSYPGYAFSFMYAFTESVGYVITNSRSGNLPSLLKQADVSKCTKFLREFQLAADACVALDDMQSGKYALEGVSENRKVEVRSVVLFHVLKVASDRICDKDTPIEKDLQQIIEASFSTLMTLANMSGVDEAKSAELFNIITFHTCNIGYAYQKRKDFKEATSWCYRSIDAYEAFKSKNVEAELKINALSIGLLLADCHRQLENYEEGLRWLSKWLVLAPSVVNTQSTAYDIYEQIPWTDWSVHWQSLQKEVCALDREEGCLSVVQYLEEDDPTVITKELASKALRLEMNSYFSGRQTVIPALLNVGQQLHDRNLSLADSVLGLVSQAVGLWWIATEESLGFAQRCLAEAISLLDETGPGIVEKTQAEVPDEILRTYLSAIVIAWKALCMMRVNQITAETELEALKNRVMAENPRKSKERQDGMYAISAFTSLSMEDEARYAVNFIEAAECFYQLSQMEEPLKSVMDLHCPALGQITIRMTALGLSALGEKINAAKAWYATYVIAKIYDRKGLVVLAASEVLKILPQTSLDCVKYAEQVNAAAEEGNLIKHNKAVYYRLDLAKAIACYEQKEVKEGLLHLAEVYKFLAKKDNFDSTHHLLAEADYVLSLYRSLALSKDIEYPPGIPEQLCKMTPAGLAVKSYKLLGGLSRESDVLSSGWTDLLHNYYLLGSIADVSSRTVKLLKETGKLRDLKCFVADTIYFYQRLGIVGRSVGLLVPLIEIDISSRNFYMAQIRIAAVAKVLLRPGAKPEKNAPDVTEARRFLENTLKIPGLSIHRLENVSNLKWQLGNIEATSFHYRNRSAKYLAALKVDCETLNIKSMEMKAPDLLRHPLTCFCYTCSHPEIIPMVLEFLVAQSKYAVAMKWKISMAVLELARLYHQRAMFRILFNMEYISEQLKAIVQRKTAVKLVNGMYCWFFFNPGMSMQLANMEICPVDDISHIVHLMNSTLRATEIIDGEDLSLKIQPLEVGTCALFEYLVTGKRIPVLAGNMAEVLQTKVEQQEKENTILVPSSPEIMEATLSPIPPPIRKRGANGQLTKQQLHGRKATVTNLRPRRILDSKAQQHQPKLSATVELVDFTKVDSVDVDRCVNIVPGPNFDDDDNNGD